MKNNFFETAKLYASNGFYVFPLFGIGKDGCLCSRAVCKNPGKHPLTKNGFHDASINQDIILRWWKQNPEANIGLATGTKSKIVVIDVDPRNGGTSSVELLADQKKLFPETWTVKTGSGGWHFYYRYPENLSVKSGSHTLGSGIDLKADGGYVVAPPSRHISGCDYNWELDQNMDRTAISPLPEWILKLFICKRNYKVETPNIWSNLINKKVSEGSRNSTLTSIVGSLLRKNVNAHLVLALVDGWNLKHCIPPLSYQEIEQVVGSVCRMERKRRGRCGRN